MRKLLLISLAVLLSSHVKSQTVRALFLGNSYTDVNNLPELVSQLALSAGDTLAYMKNTPGGYTLQAHSANASSLAMIQAGNWDYVVLQEQSQLPSFPEEQVLTDVYPYAHILDSIIHVYNPCAVTVFYNTWGRKNGDASNCPFFPPVCTYTGMDSLLQLRYRIMAEANHAALSPVAGLWRILRNNFPGIELYQSDESHPSAAGSFAAACSFYTLFFGKNPALTNYNYTLSFADATTIREVSKAYVFDSIPYWNRYRETIEASFNTRVKQDTAFFTNTSTHAGNYWWDFGDGLQSNEASPTHIYALAGTYTVKLIATGEPCAATDTATFNITVTKATGLTDWETTRQLKLYPNPATGILNIECSIPLSQFVIYDVHGNVVMKIEPLNNQTFNSIPIEHLKKGLYWLAATDTGSQLLYHSAFVKD